MANLWFYMKEGNKFGPVTARILRQLALDGEIKPTDLVSREGSGTWVDAERVKGLLPPASPAPRSPATPPDDSPYALDVPSPTPPIRTDPPETEVKGKLELDALSRFFLLHPLGLPTWIIGSVLATFIFLVFIIDKERDSPRPAPEGFFPLLAGLSFGIWIAAYVWLRVWLGRQTACSRCNQWFSKLLIKSEAQVVGSREEMHTYTGQNAIRDRNGQVTGYIDEQRTMPVTVKTVVGLRKYRCKACNHRWEISDVGKVVI
jgi:hypothetical protein